MMYFLHQVNLLTKLAGADPGFILGGGGVYEEIGHIPKI
jgi:hypothetical protein